MATTEQPAVEGLEVVGRSMSRVWIRARKGKEPAGALQKRTRVGQLHGNTAMYSLSFLQTTADVSLWMAKGRNDTGFDRVDIPPPMNLSKRY
jgi:hypothetical protein